MIRARPALRLAAVAVFAVSLGACASGPRPGGREVERKANPSAVVATEMAFARAAQEQGQWTAFRDFAAKDAVLFVPEPVLAQQWLKGRANPAQAVRWRVHKVWSSCDGTLAASTGSAQWPDGSHGMFVTVWQRQDDGSYTYVVDHGSPLPGALPEPEAVEANVADCRSGDALAAAQGTQLALPASGSGAARDHSLSYDWAVGTDRARHLRVSMIRDGHRVDVLDISEPGGTLAP